MPPTDNEMSDELPNPLYPEEVRREVCNRLRISRTQYYRVHYEALKPLMMQRTGSNETLLEREARRYINLCLRDGLKKAKAWAWAEANYQD